MYVLLTDPLPRISAVAESAFCLFFTLLIYITSFLLEEVISFYHSFSLFFFFHSFFPSVSFFSLSSPFVSLSLSFVSLCLSVSLFLSLCLFLLYLSFYSSLSLLPFHSFFLSYFFSFFFYLPLLSLFLCSFLFISFSLSLLLSLSLSPSLFFLSFFLSFFSSLSFPLFLALHLFCSLPLSVPLSFCLSLSLSFSLSLPFSFFFLRLFLSLRLSLSPFSLSLVPPLSFLRSLSSSSKPFFFIFWKYLIKFPPSLLHARKVFTFLYPYLSIFTNPSARAEYDTRSFFKRSSIGLNSEFSLTSCLTKAEEPSLHYYLPIAGGRIIGFIPFPRVLVQCEMQSVSSRIWTRVAVSIIYDDNHHITLLYLSIL